MSDTTSTLGEVKVLVAQALGIEDRLGSLDASTRLLGGLSELDSLSVVALVADIAERFNFDIDDADFTAEVFETLGTLAVFVDENRS